MRKLVSILFFVCLFVNSQAQIIDNSRYFIGYDAGLGISKIKTDTTIHSSAFLPFLHLYVERKINEKINMKAGAGFSFRGGKSDNPVTTYYAFLNDYFLGMDYTLFDYLQVGCTYQYSNYVATPFLQDLNVNMTQATSVQSHHEMIASLHLRVNRNVRLFLHANFFQLNFFNPGIVDISNDYRNINLGIAIHLGSLGREKTSFKNKLDVKKPLHVEKLKIKNQQLETFPPQIFSMLNLEKLTLKNCSIDTIPAEIAMLVNIEQIDLRKNKISYIPEEITKLSNLRKLNLSKNQIEYIPKEMLSMPRLKKINVSDNPIDLPASVPSQIKLIY